jgi:hypothetical protein
VVVKPVHAGLPNLDDLVTLLEEARCNGGREMKSRGGKEMKSQFRPRDPQATHARFAKVLERVTKKIEAEIEAERDLTAALKPVEGPKRAA